jgi:chaperonin GroES
MKVRPLHDRVLLKRLEQKEMVKGGIIIPDTAKEKPMEGEVIAVGPGKMMDDGKRAAMDVNAGDRVLFGKYAGSEIKIDDQEYVIMREEEILAVLGK